MTLKYQSINLVERNQDLFRKVAEAIRDNKKLYNQKFWGEEQVCKSHTCGTAHCIGGWAVKLAGYKPEYKNEWDSVTNDGIHCYSTSELAAKLLGLSQVEAGILFDGKWKPKGKKGVYTTLIGFSKGKPIR